MCGCVPLSVVALRPGEGTGEVRTGVTGSCKHLVTSGY